MSLIVLVSFLACGILVPQKWEWKLRSTLCDLMDCSLLDSSVHGILQAIKAPQERKHEVLTTDHQGSPSIAFDWMSADS